MTKLYKQIKLECFEILREYALEYSKNFISKSDGAIYHSFPQDIKNILDEETKNLGLGVSGVPLYFYKTSTKMDYQSTHVDASIMNKKINLCNLSLVLPIRGCKNTKHFWYGGNYTLEIVTKNNIEYSEINWSGTPQFLDAVEIYEHPTLCNVNTPHGVVTNDSEQRVTCTIRFDKNPYVEDFV